MLASCHLLWQAVAVHGTLGQSASSCHTPLSCGQQGCSSLSRPAVCSQKAHDSSCLQAALCISSLWQAASRGRKPPGCGQQGCSLPTRPAVIKQLTLDRCLQAAVTFSLLLQCMRAGFASPLTAGSRAALSSPGLLHGAVVTYHRSSQPAIYFFDAPSCTLAVYSSLQAGVACCGQQGCSAQTRPAVNSKYACDHCSERANVSLWPHVALCKHSAGNLNIGAVRLSAVHSRAALL